MKKNLRGPLRIFASILLTNILIAILTGLLIWFDLFDALQTNFLLFHTMAFTLGLLNTILIFWFIKTVDKKSPKMLGFHLRKKDILFSTVAIIITFITVWVFILALAHIGIVKAQFQFDLVFTGGFYKLLGIAIVGYFFAALKEEVLARGYFMLNLKSFSIPSMILISAILFMALHFIMGDFDPFKAASWLKGGLVYAYIYVKSGSLTTATIVHAAHNLVNDLFIHGADGALVLLNTKVATSDKLVYEFILGVLLLGLTYLFYGKNGLFTPADNLKLLWNKGRTYK
ncbi:CAAX prenyl protease-like protein [Ureibacillus xyleni]|uniref:CAAX prenyl protease-like protein n=1 Tax=Ureibacillus xyleni TaxID=614648 RepID=A0A285SKF6_9BACL|nr:type II CAAX endopeptidase family protein [Ureibacillus xyleni]SOC08434.1 CAAX prenyl protease-like protein [Ureibacillus xyleni]